MGSSNQNKEKTLRIYPTSEIVFTNIIKILNIIFKMIYKSCFYVKYDYKINIFKSILFNLIIII